MKILYVITQADGGGAQNYVLALAKYFRGAIAAGDSTLRDDLSSDSKSNEASGLFKSAQNLQLETYNLEHLKRDINPWHDILAVWEIRQLIQTLRPDIVHLNSTKAGILGSFAAIGLKTKVVFTAHGFVFNEPMSKAKRSFYIALEKMASDFRKFIICVSEADRQSALKNNLIDQKKISTIYNGLPTLNFLAKDEARSQLGLPQNVLVVGNNSNFYATKGQDIFVDAVSLLPQEILDKTIFAIFGSGPELENIKLKIKTLKLDSSFRLFGQVANSAQYLKALDLFVLPSRKEGFPFGLLEAMAAGLPIIASNVGGAKEALNDAALLIQPSDKKELSQAIISVLTSKTKAQELSNKALARSVLFTEQRMLEATKKVYDSITQIN